MRRLARRAALAGLLVLVVAAAPAPVPNASELVIAGHVRHGMRLDMAELRHLPPVEERVSFRGEQGEQTATFQGVRLWTLLDQAGAFDPAKPRSRVAATLTATGRDGYTVALALAEIDPAFEGKAVLIAYAADGHAPAGGGFRLVVPGDQRGGRSVRDVVRIEVR
ncbi:MAG: molybdopterin-dependent oxidoreductase [Pseudomonadota bacterium]|nr:molybdopterin-dependent oxidoreductase [Pseudomonadota bacterium]